ncbi:hypothetical protein M080_2640 [Bacteroides fragilis str. 3397 T10]|nr:hypothetical protein M080_2640 [Bacteroides fragilis str. 3397 T10]
MRRRQSLGSFEVQTAQVHPISGTPVEVPLPSILIFISFNYQSVIPENRHALQPHRNQIKFTSG